MMQSLLQTLLTTLAQAYLRRYNPKIIAITGNVGKTSTKEAVGVVLGSRHRVRVSGGNLNNDIGVPLNILGDWAQGYNDQGSSLGLWVRVLLHGAWGLMTKIDYPEILILEYAADRPGDIGRLAKLYKPNIGVVTAIGEIPVHVEYFSDPEALAQEKLKLIKALDAGDLAILNYDDPVVLEMREQTRAQIKTFGFGEAADMKISNLETAVTQAGLPSGVNFKLHSDRGFVPVQIQGSLGKAQAYAGAAAALVGVHLGMNMVQVSEGLSQFNGMPGRLRILPGIKQSIIIDDTYNAAPASMHLALDVLASFPAQRKVAILGDMLELGKYSLEAHEAVGNKAGEIAQVLIAVGEKAKFIADAAGNQLPRENIFTFHTSDEAKQKAQEIIKEGDLILVKGSQGKRMEKIVQEIMAEPDRKKEFLVRQSKKWVSQ